MAYTYASLADLFDRYAELKAEGITPYWCVHHGITVSIYFGDPDARLADLRSGTPASVMPVRTADLPVSPIRGTTPVDFDRSAW